MQRTLFGPDHEVFRESFKKFLAREVAPHHAGWRRRRSSIARSGERLVLKGFLGMAVPDQYGGGGVDDFRFNTVIT
jgi:alkylation response protein AidB-like acyl-CoA dehydrogenase